MPFWPYKTPFLINPGLTFYLDRFSGAGQLRRIIPNRTREISENQNMFDIISVHWSLEHEAPQPIKPLLWLPCQCILLIGRDPVVLIVLHPAFLSLNDMTNLAAWVIGMARRTDAMVKASSPHRPLAGAIRPRLGSLEQASGNLEMSVFMLCP